MGKKILKRSLVIGSLMTFVITGNTWAEEYNGKLPETTGTHIFTNHLELMNASSGLYSTEGGSNPNKYHNIYPSAGYSNNRVITQGNIFYKVTNRHFFLQSGRFADSTSSGDVTNNRLYIKHNVGAYKAIEMYGGSIHDSNGQVCNVKGNYVYIGIDESRISIESETSNIMIVGGISNLKANASDNHVKICNANFTANGITIIGAMIRNVGDVKDNSVDINNISVNNIYMYGGLSNDGIVIDNNLNISGNVDGGAKLISNFSVINYDDLKWEAKDIVIKTEKLELDDSKQITVNVNGLANGSTPKKGEVVTLLDTGEVKYDNQSFEGQYLEESTSTFNSGTFLKAEGKIYQENEDIKLKITRVGTNDQALVIGESRAAATAFTNQGSELIEIGLDSLARDKSEKETKVFASIFGNASEYATGSHIKVNGWSGIVGVAKTNDDGLTKGAFFENGEGNYRTFNNFKGDFMRGDGEANYNGGGFFVRKDHSNGVYTEASLRAGNLQNELHKAIVGSEGLAGYDIDTFYYGAHLGVGKIIPRGSEGDSIDVYGKFIYTHHDSEDFTIDGDEFHFDSVDSERLRLGFRINEVQNKKLNMYYGAAWEYEFGGDADNTVVSYDLSTPSLSGSTVIGEIGMHYKASEKWSVDINGRAYTGQRDGFTGSVQANYAF